MSYISVKNQQCIPVESIPETGYNDFLIHNTGLIKHNKSCHCVSYFGYRVSPGVKLICCIADDIAGDIKVSSCIVADGSLLYSFSAYNLVFEKFERELFENFGLHYIDHPWLKPLRYSYNRVDMDKDIRNYPFYSIHGEDLHEVGVGPVHAGIIEPGHFRFICNGEQILHLEIQLGFQHRGVEHLFLQKKKMLELSTLAENIAGDSVIEHTSAFAYLWESLTGFNAGPDILFARTLAQEIERVAIHTGDLSAICTDVAYHLGSSVLGRLRTPIINYFQEWCGNRLSKSLIRPGRNQFPYTFALADRLNEVLDKYEPDFLEICNKIFNLPSVLSRIERTGILSTEQLEQIGTVGMAARMGGIKRDIRFSHSYGLFSSLQHEPVLMDSGDVYARAMLRFEETRQSLQYIRKLITEVPQNISEPFKEGGFAPNSFVISLTEGWRGEVAHTAITDEQGNLICYKIKDPSFHNWLALALAVRNNEISDFPICNKSFDLSYCGHDL